MSDVNWDFIRSNFKPLRQELDGSQHFLRMPKDMRVYTDIDTDQEMVVRFLRKFENSPDSFRAYVQELYRLKLWAEKIRCKCLSALTQGDFEDYKDFAMSPPEDWIGWSNALRGTPNWRPFIKPLARTTVQQALTRLSSFYSFLAKSNYTKYNPIVDISYKPDARTATVRASAIHDKCFSEVQLAYITKYLHGRKSFEASRWRILVLIMYFNGLRIHEVAKCKMGDFRFHDKLNHWVLSVIGKGNKAAELPVHPYFLEELMDYRQMLELPFYPAADEETPLIMDRGGKALKRRRISGIFRELITNVAAIMPDGHEKDAIVKLTPHSFRHTSITEQSKPEIGMDMNQRMELSRHTNEKTLQGYSHANRNTLFDKFQKMRFPMSA